MAGNVRTHRNIVFACMPSRLKHMICHAKFNCPVGVVAAAAAAAVAVVIVVAAAAVVVVIIHGFIQPRVIKCLEIYHLQTLVLMA